MGLIYINKAVDLKAAELIISWQILKVNRIIDLNQLLMHGFINF
jgi:hypothetical protein